MESKMRLFKTYLLTVNTDNFMPWLHIKHTSVEDFLNYLKEQKNTQQCIGRLEGLNEILDKVDDVINEIIERISDVVPKSKHLEHKHLEYIRSTIQRNHLNDYINVRMGYFMQIGYTNEIQRLNNKSPFEIDDASSIVYGDTFEYVVSATKLDNDTLASIPEGGVLKLNEL